MIFFLRNKIDKMVNNYHRLKKNSKRNNPSDIKSKEEFLDEILKCFWISKKKEELIEDIRKDRRRTSKVKNEDIAFILDQLGNRVGRIGTHDKKFAFTIKRSHNKSCSMTNAKIKLSNSNTPYILENSSSSDNNSDYEYVADIKKELPNSVVSLPKNI